MKIKPTAVVTIIGSWILFSFCLRERSPFIVLFTREITIHSFDVLGDIIIHNIVLRRDHHSQFFVGEII
jgi:hypothetical protein